MPQYGLSPLFCSPQVRSASQRPETAHAPCLASQDRIADVTALKKKPRINGALRYCAETGGVLFRDFSDSTDWRPPHPANNYTPEFSFVKLTIRYLYITFCYLSAMQRKCPPRQHFFPKETDGTVTKVQQKRAGSYLPALVLVS